MASQNELIFALIEEIVKDKNLTNEEVANILKNVLTKVYTKVYTNAVLDVKVDFDNKVFVMKKQLKVVDDNYYDNDGDDDCEIDLTQARKINPDAKIDDLIEQPIDLKSFDNTMVRSVQQLFKQKVSEMVNEKIYNQWKDKKGTIVSGKIEMTDPVLNFSFVEFDGTKGFVKASDKIPNETLEINNTYKFYVKDVMQQTKGWPIILSRTDANFIKGLLRLEVPEIAQDIVEIISVAREPGIKTKVAVKSNNANINPISTCVGNRASRINAVYRELNGVNEKIEFVKYYDDIAKFIASACLPSRIDGLEVISKEEKVATIIVPKESLSLIIGLRGINIRLISKLTGWNLEIKTREDAENENIKYDPVDFSIYDKSKSNKDVMLDFASTNEILRNLEKASSYEQIQSALDLKDNYSLNNNLFETKKEIEKKEFIVNEELTKNSDLSKQDTNSNELKETIVQQDIDNVLEENKAEVIKPKTNKVDYLKLRSEHANNEITTNLDALLDSKETTEKKPKRKFKKVNKNLEQENKQKNKNILDEFDDITQEYLTYDEDEEFDDDNNSYDEFDDEYDN